MTIYMYVMYLLVLTYILGNRLNYMRQVSFVIVPDHNEYETRLKLSEVISDVIMALSNST